MTYEEAREIILDSVILQPMDCDIIEKDQVIELVIEALEKQIPKKPTSHIVEFDGLKIRNGTWRKGTTVHRCPNCNAWLDIVDECCHKCGQKIDW